MRNLARVYRGEAKFINGAVSPVGALASPAPYKQGWWVIPGGNAAVRCGPLGEKGPPYRIQTGCFPGRDWPLFRLWFLPCVGKGSFLERRLSR